MTLSAGLSDRQARDGGGKSIFNADALKQEGNLSEQVQNVITELSRLYPTIKFNHRKEITKKEIYIDTGVSPNYKPSSNRSKGPKPDGGILFANINNKWFPILISEAKKQGTNNILRAIEEMYDWNYSDERIADEVGWKVERVTKVIKDAKFKQARGNAIERAFKNWAEFQIYLENYDYFPYLIFASGCDFEKGSTIPDRMDSMTRGLPRNVDYTFHPRQLGTIYMQDNLFTGQEIYDILLKTAVNVIEHIING